jgi:hypothetical protein
METTVSKSGLPTATRRSTLSPEKYCCELGILMNRQINKKGITMIDLHAIEDKDANRPDSKPEKLAKIMYEGIVRYVTARKSLIREKSSSFAVDFSGDRRVNMHTEEY